MVVLLIGTYLQYEFDRLKKEIEDQGGEAIIVDTEDWPSQKQVAYDVAAEEIQIEDRTFSPSDVEGALVRQNGLFIPSIEDHRDGFVSEDENPYAALTQLREYRGLFRSFLRAVDDAGGTVSPGVEALAWQEESVRVCHLLEQNNIPTPESLATTDDDAAVEFLERHGEVVFKPVAELGEANLMSAEDSDRLNSLTTPVLFQEVVPGRDVRAYVVDDTVVGAFEYVSSDDEFSFKNEEGDPEAKEFELNQETVADVREAVALSPLNFAAVDLRISQSEGHTVLEVNAGGRFMLADSSGVTNVTEPLTDLLTENDHGV